MDRQAVLDKLREYEPVLRARGVRHAALFGSVARGTQRPESDIDILINIEPGAIQDLYAYGGLKHFIAALFFDRVDVVAREALKPYLLPSAEVESIYAV